MENQLTLIDIRPHVAQIRIEKKEATFDIKFAAKDNSYSIAFQGTHCFRLTQPFSPDDGWEFEALNAPGLSLPKSDCLPPSLKDWLGSTGIPFAEEIVNALPSGNYFLVLTNIPVRECKHILVGNEAALASRNMLEVFRGPPVYMMLMGPNSQLLPSLSQPIVCLPVLNYTGITDSKRVDVVQTGIIGLTFPLQSDAGVAQHSQQLLVLPSQGKLILDNYRGFGFEAKSTEIWLTCLLPRFIDALIDD